MIDKKTAGKRFAFEELDVWVRSVDFAERVISLTESLNTNRTHYRLLEQIEAAVTSIALNIAEGKGRFSKKEFVQFLYIARGSLYEVITLIIIFHKKGWINEDALLSLKEDADQIGKMLTGLANSIKNTCS